MMVVGRSCICFSVERSCVWLGTRRASFGAEQASFGAGCPVLAPDNPAPGGTVLSLPAPGRAMLPLPVPDDSVLGAPKPAEQT